MPEATSETEVIIYPTRWQIFKQLFAKIPKFESTQEVSVEFELSDYAPQREEC